MAEIRVLVGDIIEQEVDAIVTAAHSPHRRARRAPYLGALLRPIRAVLVEAHDAWQASDRHYRAERFTAKVITALTGAAATELVAA